MDQTISSTEITPTKITQDITPNKIIKRGSQESVNDFLKVPDKISKSQRRQMNKAKRKLIMDNTSSKTAIISSLDNFDKKTQSGLVPLKEQSTSNTKDVDIAMIGADAYRAACRLKEAQVFAVSLKDLQYQAEKEARAETDPKSVVPEEYHDFLDVFSKKNSDTLPPHRKYDHKIQLEEEQKPGHAPLYKMSSEELDAVKRYLDSYLANGFIQASSASYSSPVLFIKKPGGGIRFCVDYQRLNAITKKDRYPNKPRPQKKIK